MSSNEPSFSISPNPSAYKINLKLHNTKAENIIIYNVLGEEVFQQTLIGGLNHYIIDIYGLENGLYYVKLNGAELPMKHQVLKLIKQGHE